MTFTLQRQRSQGARVRSSSFQLAPLVWHVATACAAIGAPGLAAAQSANTLPPVVVTATRFPEEADKLTFGVSVITAEQIRNAGVTTVNEAVMKLLGVPGRLDFYGGGDYSLDLRGFGSTSDNNQAIVVDGVKINEGDLGGTRLAGISIDDVERIEVIRGNSAVLYGEGATGGAIVITTKAGRGLARQNSAQVYAGVGSHNLADVRGNATIAVGDVTLDASANTRSTKNWRRNYDSTVDGTALGAQWRGDGVRAGARYAEDQLEGGLPGSLSAAQYAADPTQTNTPANRSSIHNKRYGVFAEADLGPWQIAADIGRRQKALRSTGYGYDVGAATQGLRARNTTTFGAMSNAVVIGFDRAEWTRDVLGAFGSRAEQTSRALYAKDDLTLSTGTRLNAGVRFEKIEKTTTDAPTSPVDSSQRAWELGALQPIGPVSVYGRFGRSFRLGNVDEIGFTTGSGLRPQTSRDLEAGVRWKDARSRAELRVYRSELNDEIAYDPTAGLFGANVNLDPTRRQGVELELAHAITSTANVRFNAAQRQARFVEGANSGRDVPLVPHRTASVQADWTFFDRHTVDAVLRTVSTQHPDAANACTMPRYTTADLRYAFRQGALELAFGVANLTDRKYYTLAFACAAGQPSAIYPEDGRAFTASARLRF